MFDYNKGDFMKFKYIATGLVVATLGLSACDININTGSGGDSKNSDKQGDNNNDNNQSSSNNNTSSNNQNTESTNSPQHYAKVWLSVIGNNNDIDDLKINHKDISGEVLNPYNESASATYPNATQALYGSYTAAGQVIYKDNNDGTIDVYDVPSHFQDKRWDEDEYSKNESNRILNNPKTINLKNISQSEIDNITSIISESNDSSESSSTDDSNNDDSSEKVTRDNVIDKVEDYEGEQLDTSQYTYKEPEQSDNGDWGFSFTDKDGDLAGSYIVDQDGNVTKYDEDGEPE